MSTRSLLTVVVGAALWAGGCGSAEHEEACGQGQVCSIPESREALLATLEGHADPVADWLRGAAEEDGTVGRDWNEVLGGVASTLGCDAERTRSFVVLSNLGLAPKGLVTHCSDDPVEASRFFAVFEPNQQRSDLDAERFRMVGWDAQVGAYRLYQMVPRHDALTVSVEPVFCATCHGGQSRRSTWVPVMNEMTNPWAQWNAEPGFRSVAFDEHFESTMIGEVFEAVADPIRLDSAARLEPVIRAGIDRVTAASVARRGSPPDLELAFELLAPVFCDETYNYVSEVHRSGEIRMSALLDSGLRRMVQALEPAERPWAWVHEDSVFVPPPRPDETAIVLMAVRGEVSVQAEAALVSRRVLTPMQVLRVRALDWTRPIGSGFRCDLFESGRARILADPPELEAHADTATLVSQVFDELLHVQTDQGLVSLATGDELSLVAIADVQDPEVEQALRAGALSGSVSSVVALGEEVEAYVTGMTQGADARARLVAERNRRACEVRRRDLTAPTFEGIEACP